MTALPIPTARSTPQIEIRRVASLAWTLGITEWKLRFYGSVLGYLWSLVRPFAFFGVVYVVFTKVAKLGNGIPNYSVYILFSMVLFQFFSEVTTGCLSSLTARENLLRKIRFPRAVIPMSVVLTALLNLTMTLVAVFIFALATGVDPRWSWLELIPIVGLIALFAFGLGMLLSVLYVRFRDVQPIWEVVTQALFYASPVLYVASMVPDRFEAAFLCNPIAALLTQMRNAVVDASAPTAWTEIGGALRLLIPLGVIAIAIAIGAWSFAHEAPKIPERL